MAAESEHWRSFDMRLGNLEDRHRNHGERIAALEDRTAGQRSRIAALEAGMAQVHNTLGRIEDRAEHRGERLAELERQARGAQVASSAPSHPLAAIMTDLRVLLIGAILIGMALGKAGVDPTSWFR